MFKAVKKQSQSIGQTWKTVQKLLYLSRFAEHCDCYFKIRRNSMWEGSRDIKGEIVIGYLTETSHLIGGKVQGEICINNMVQGHLEPNYKVVITVRSS